MPYVTLAMVGRPSGVYSGAVVGDLSFTATRGGVPRIGAGVAALAFPVLLIAIAVDVGFRSGGDMGDLAGSFLGAILFLVAAPTGWVFSIEFVDAGRFTVLFTAMLTSLPLWYVAGSFLATLSESWLEWLKRYGAVCLSWSSLSFLIIGIAGQFSG